MAGSRRSGARLHHTTGGAAQDPDDKTGLAEFAQGLARFKVRVLSTGGTATDVTDVIHPDNREMAERAVRAIGLDVGGVDFLQVGYGLLFKYRDASNGDPGLQRDLTS